MHHPRNSSKPDRGRRTGTRAVAVLGAAAFVASTAVGAAAQPTGEVEHLGTPLRDVLLLGGDVGPGPEGDPVIWSVSTSTPAVLNAVDPDTGELVDSFPMEGAGGAWAVEVAADGSVYAGTYSSSHLFRWSEETGLVDLGNPLDSGTFVWDVKSDDDGVVYGGMSPNGALFSYDPATEEFRDYGRLSDADYVRSVAYEDGVVYAGTSRPATIFAVDPESGESQALPAPPGANAEAEYVYDLNASDGYLYARYGEAFPNDLFVYDIAAGEWTGRIETAHGLDVTEAGPDGTVYLIADNELHSYDPATDTLEGTGVPFTGRVANTRGIGWAELSDPDFPGLSVVGLLWRGGMFRYSPQTGNFDFLDTGIEGTPIPVTVLEEGPGGTMHAGGYLSGGFATLDLVSGEQESFHRFAQLEGMTTHGGALYIGAYPDARLYEYDPTAPWHSPEYSPSPEPGAEENPRQLINLLDDEQERASALTSAGDYVALGTEAELDRYGGVFLLWDPESREVVHKERGMIEDQSIVELTYRDGIVYGASSIYGSYTATAPRATEAVIFAWSVAERELLWQTAPVPGAPTVEDIAFADDGTLWGSAGGDLFALDVATQEVLDVVDGPDGGFAQLLEYNELDGLLYVDWGSAGLWWHDLETGEQGLAAEHNARDLVADSRGQVWFSAGNDVYRFGTEGDDPGPGPEPTPPGSGPGFHLSNDWRGTTHHVFQYGRANDEVFIGDWDGDGRDTITVRRENRFYVSNSLRAGEADQVFVYGRPGDVVLAGDWDGDGRDTFAVRRGREYLVKNSLSGGVADRVFHYGREGDVVLAGDWDGERGDTLAVRRGREYHVKNSLSGGRADIVVPFGRPSDEVFVGDWDGNGTDTLGIRRAG